MDCDLSRKTLGSELQDDSSATISALLARAGFLASIGEFQTDKQSVLQKLAESQHGRQLTDEVARFESAGGKVVRESLTNWNQSGNAWKDLVNWSGDLASNNGRSITYRRNLIDSTLDFARNNGPVGPRSASARLLAHEIGHLDGILGNWGVAASGVNHPRVTNQKWIAAWHIREESDAIISELKWQQTIGRAVSDGAAIQSHLAKGTLGSTIQKHWTYPAMRYLSAVEADTIANTHIQAVFGNIIDHKGAIGSYSPEYVRMRNSEIYKMGRPLSPLKTLGEVPGTNLKLGLAVGRAAQVVGVVGAAYMLTDVYDSFKRGPAEGMESILKIGADWGGWEYGVGLALKSTSKRSPIACVIGGIVGSSVADNVFRNAFVPSLTWLKSTVTGWSSP